MAYADRHLLVTFKGTPYRYYPGKATPKLARACRAQFDGLGPIELWRTWFAQVAMGPDMAASLLWICRRQMADMLGMPDFAMTLDQIDDLIGSSDDVGNHLTLEFIDFTDDADKPAPIEEVTATTVNDDGETHLEVQPDPEG